MDDADKCRNLADHAREQAVKSIDPLDKERWLRMAEEWLRLAQDTEKQNVGGEGKNTAASSVLCTKQHTLTLASRKGSYHPLRGIDAKLSRL